MQPIPPHTDLESLSRPPSLLFKGRESLRSQSIITLIEGLGGETVEQIEGLRIKIADEDQEGPLTSERVLSSLNSTLGRIYEQVGNIEEQYENVAFDETEGQDLSDSQKALRNKDNANQIESIKDDLKMLSQNMHWMIEGIDSESIRALLSQTTHGDKRQELEEFTSLTAEVQKFIENQLKPEAAKSIYVDEVLSQKGKKHTAIKEKFSAFSMLLHDLDLLLNQTGSAE